jgi:hypothetical protein
MDAGRGEHWDLVRVVAQGLNPESRVYAANALLNMSSSKRPVRCRLGRNDLDAADSHRCALVAMCRRRERPSCSRSHQPIHEINPRSEGAASLPSAALAPKTPHVLHAAHTRSPSTCRKPSVGLHEPSARGLGTHWMYADSPTVTPDLVGL